jgi:uncharacterized protein YcnI
VTRARRTSTWSIALLGLIVVILAATPAMAHTEPDLVAVPAGDEVTLTLRPMHGCDAAATVEVTAGVPVAGASADVVAGWTSGVEDDGEGNTVVTWTGGRLPADQAGAFPTTFTVPAAVGELLTFPFVQTCEGGAERAWISGDPAADHPAPRVLVLAPGSRPAATIGEVPGEAPGREQLVEIVDVDGGPTTAGPAGPTSTTSPSTTAVADGEPDDEMTRWGPTVVRPGSLWRPS